jgi:hypothetical protein
MGRYPVAGGCLGVDLGIEAGAPFIAIEDTRVSISAEDLAYLTAACMSMQHLAGGIGVASRVAQAPPGSQPWWQNYTRRFIEDNPHPWYED